MMRPIVSVLSMAAALTLLGQGASAQDAASLISSDPANRSAESDVSRAIARMIAERSSSSLVRERAAPNGRWGALQPTLPELLADIGQSGVRPAAYPAPTTSPPASVAPPPSPPPAAQTTHSPPSAAPATPSTEAAASAPAATPPAAQTQSWLELMLQNPVQRTGADNARGGSNGDGGGGGGGGAGSGDGGGASSW